MRFQVIVQQIWPSFCSKGKVLNTLKKYLEQRYCFSIKFTKKIFTLLQSKIFKHRPGSRILNSTYFHRYHLSLSIDVTICKPEHTMKVDGYALRTQFTLFNRLFRLWNRLKYHAANLRLVRVRLHRAAPNGPERTSA